MEEIFDLSIKLHIFFAISTILIAAYILYLFYADIEYVPLTRKVEFITIWYYVVLAALAFTGLIALTVQKFLFSFIVILMICASVLILITGIKEYKLFKKTRVKDIKSQEKYREFAKKKYLWDICLIIIIGVISAVFVS